MEQDQEKMEDYEVCNKNDGESSVGFDFENGGYGLRENPKKSWKISDPDSDFPEKDHLCKICRKGFNSQKALFGHLRHHSSTKKKNSIEAEDEAFFKLDDENLGNLRKKRSIRRRSKADSNSFLSGLDFEEIELGICLLMLPHGIKNWVRKVSVSPEEFEYSPVKKPRSLGSYQGLGSHSGSHGSRKSELFSEMDGHFYDMRDGFEGEMGKTKEEHRCGICFKGFESGQALGGHKRAHNSKNSVIMGH